MDKEKVSKQLQGDLNKIIKKVKAMKYDNFILALGSKEKDENGLIMGNCLISGEVPFLVSIIEFIFRDVNVREYVVKKNMMMVLHEQLKEAEGQEH